MEDITNVRLSCLIICILIGVIGRAPVRAAAVTNYGACTTPNHERGVCVQLEDCSALYQLISPAISNNDRMFLRRSQCGYNGDKVFVCCPDAPAVPTPTPTTGKANTMTNATVRANETAVTNGTYLAQPPHCGIVLTDHIIGGHATGIYDFPWMALIEYTKPGNEKGHHCGGSLINDRYIVTGAHCVNGRKVPVDWVLSGVRLGEWDRSTSPDCEVDVRGNRECAPAHMDIAVEDRIPHPHYLPGSENQIHDIALLRLATKVQYNAFVRPICLPLVDEVRLANFHGYSMDIVGWGQTLKDLTSAIKQKAVVKVWELQTCRTKYAQSALPIADTQMCAGGEKDVDSCQGDSGGPLVVPQKIGPRIAYFLAGVVSYGPTPCGLTGWPGVYTRVGAYVDWIQQTVKA